MYRLVKWTLDTAFAWKPLRFIRQRVFGYRCNGWMLGLVGYRAVHMIRQGESCILAGIFSERTIRDYATIAGPAGHVLVVEANPANVARLKASVADLANVTITNRAVWNAPGQMDFVVSEQEKDQGYNRLADDQIQAFPMHMDDAPQLVKVRTDTLDRLAREHRLGPVTHLNLTINGAELPALDAISEIRKQSPGLRIYINAEYPDPADKVIARLKGLGFRVYTSRWIRVKNDRITLLRIYAIDETSTAVLEPATGSRHAA